MSRISGRDTSPERVVRCTLHAAGFRFRLHRKDLAGTPHIVLPGLQVAIFVHGCFWHGHSCAKGRKRPQTSVDFWETKLTRNTERDAAAQAALASAGWAVKVIWECELGEACADLVDDLKRRRAMFRA